MHRVVKAHLNDFQKKFNVSKDESKQFEAFLNYSLFRSFCADNIDPSTLIYEGDDPGIDGIMTFIDDTYVSSADEVEDTFKGRKRDSKVTLVLTQAKTSESWEKSEINTFQSAVIDFFSDDHEYPHSEYMDSHREVFDTLLKKVGRIQNGKPDIHCYFATTARETTAREIVAAKRALAKALADTGLFENIEVFLFDRDKIVELWRASEGQIEANLPVLGMAAFPKTDGIEESYVVTVRASDFIEKILSDKNDRIRQRIFEENVRDFIGLDGEINTEISQTLSDLNKQKRFGVLNNGITIISPDIRVSGLEIFIRDFQIVNGCQTSNILFEHREKVIDSATLMLKIVETSDPQVVDDIVRSTNRQSKVEEDQFLATLDCIKGLERYFDARGTDEEYRLYFERRKNQFLDHENVKAIRIFDIKEIARCVSAMFLDKPEIASRYPNRLTGEMHQTVFDRTYHEEIYHVAAYALYRIKILMSNSKIDPRYGKLRWHIIMAIKYYICGKDIPNLSSKKIKQTCQKIESFISGNDENTVAEIKSLCAAVVEIKVTTRDSLRNASLALEIKSKALAHRKLHVPKQK